MFVIRYLCGVTNVLAKLYKFAPLGPCKILNHHQGLTYYEFYDHIFCNRREYSYLGYYYLLIDYIWQIHVHILSCHAANKCEVHEFSIKRDECTRLNSMTSFLSYSESSKKLSVPWRNPCSLEWINLAVAPYIFWSRYWGT